MAEKIIKFNGNVDEINWGSWNEVKKSIIVLGSKYTINYHGDIFLSYESLKKLIDQAVGYSSIEFQFIFSFHQSGSDFLPFFDGTFEDTNYSLEILKRIFHHDGVSIVGHYNGEDFSWNVTNNKNSVINFCKLIHKKLLNEIENKTANEHDVELFSKISSAIICYQELDD